MDNLIKNFKFSSLDEEGKKKEKMYLIDVIKSIKNKVKDIENNKGKVVEDKKDENIETQKMVIKIL